MKKKEFLKFYKNQFHGVNVGGGEWKFTLKEEGEYGYLKIIPRLLKSPPIQRVAPGVTMSPSWYAELVHFIREDEELDHLIHYTYRIIPKDGEVFEEHLVESLEMVYSWYEDNNTSEVISAYLSKIYSEGLTPDRTVWARYFYTCVLKGDVEILEKERLAKEDGSSELPPIFTLKFFTNAVTLAKEYKSGDRVCPIDF